MIYAQAYIRELFGFVDHLKNFHYRSFFPSPLFVSFLSTRVIVQTYIEDKYIYIYLNDWVWDIYTFVACSKNPKWSRWNTFVSCFFFASFDAYCMLTEKRNTEMVKEMENPRTLMCAQLRVHSLHSTSTFCVSVRPFDDDIVDEGYLLRSLFTTHIYIYIPTHWANPTSQPNIYTPRHMNRAKHI